MNKQEILNEYTKQQFIDFLRNDNNSQILELLNQEGISILKNSHLKEEKIKLILTYSKYKNELLQNIDFIDLIISSNINKYYALLKDLDNKTYETILNRCIQLNIDDNTLSRLFTIFSNEFKLYVIERKLLEKNIIIKVFNKSHNPQIVEKILNTYDIDLTNESVNVSLLFEKAKKHYFKEKSINIKQHLITKELAKRLYKEFDIFKLRKVLNDAQYSVNIDVLNEYVKSEEEKHIYEESLTFPYNEMFDCYKENKIDEFNLLCKKYNVNSSDITINMNKYGIRNNSLEEVFNNLKKLSDRNISNYIIDYHFEENYHNIILDITELLEYNYDGNITISKDKLDLYEKIMNIDYFTKEEKIELHETLKKYNIKEMFYDDMRYARDMVSESIKEYSLTKESLEEFKDVKLSKEYGVDVYNMDGKPFFALIKTGRKITNKYPVGHSFSLVGTNAMAVFGNKSYGETYVYDSKDLTKEQIVHVFPYDSYTRYKPFEEIEEASMRVNVLMTPQKLTTYSSSYNELLVLERGNDETYMDEYIPRLKQIALYCIDEITENDIQIAKQNNVGIVLIDSSKYQEYLSNKRTINNYEENKYNYFNGTYEKEYYEERRR